MKLGSPSNYRVLLLGQIFPDSLQSKIMEQEILPIQTQRFGLALLDALRAGFDGNVEVLSSAPLLDYPHSRLILAPGANWQIDNKIKATMLPFLNLAILKHLTRFVATFTFVFPWILRNKNFNLVIILHGVQSCKLWGVLLSQILTPTVVVPFLTDDIGIQLKWENFLLKKLRYFDVYFIKLGLQKVSGIMAMTPKLASKLAPDRPTLIMPTIQNSKSSPISSKIRNLDVDTFTIVYTGGLTQSYGINLLLNTFRLANRANWRLLITGWGEMEDEVRDFSLKNQHVEYLGVLDPEKLSEVYQRADVFVNPKLTSTSLSGLAFPSKIVEYLITGKPVISTNLPIYDDGFRQHLIIAQSDSPEDLIRCLDFVMSWDEYQRESWRQQSLLFVNEELSPEIQGTRIRWFIDSLSKKGSERLE